MNILIRHGFATMPRGKSQDKSLEHLAAVATVAGNLAYFGYCFDTAGMGNLRAMSTKGLEEWWPAFEAELKEVTGESRNMGDFVVYKNFPQEVIDKDEAEYWMAQLCIYSGIPSDWVSETPEPRKEMKKLPKPKVLHLANPLTLQSVLNSHLASPIKWGKAEKEEVFYLAEKGHVDASKIVFKENMVNLVAFFMKKGKQFQVKTATDVLRLAASLSGGDPSLREKFRFRRFSRPERRFFLGMIDSCDHENISEDFARRKELWKRFSRELHAGDYANLFPNVVTVLDDLYNNNFEYFNSQVEQLLEKKDSKVLELLQKRPGEFMRRLVHTIDLFGPKTVKAFSDDKVLSKLTNGQLMSIRRHLDTVNNHYSRMIAPGGKWSKLKIEPVRNVEKVAAAKISKAIGEEMKLRFENIGPKVLDIETENVKLPSGGSETSIFTRGTVFPIPKDVSFVRSASYWDASHETVWFDNGWNFFDDEWKAKGVICWNVNPTGFAGKSALFSGDPVNSSATDGKACQVIDLYLDKLKKKGIRYAVWNVLCYSNKSFDDVKDVYGLLQWGEDETAGKLFEPSRAQLSFELTGKNLTKYICYLDLETREMTFTDVSFPGNVSSAGQNSLTLQENMPAFVEHMDSIPSVYDLFKDSEKKDGNGYVLYSDSEVEIEDGERAYVFQAKNQDNTYQPVDIQKLLEMKRLDKPSVT